MAPSHRRPRVAFAALGATVALGAGLLVAGALTPADASQASPTTTAGPHFTAAGCQRLTPDQLKAHFARCFALVRTDVAHQIAANATQPLSGALGPADIQAAYKLPATGQGQTVGIVDAFGDSHAESDLAVFRAHFGLPSCTILNGCLKVVNQNGDTSPLPTDDKGWALETSLDLDAVSSACPNCHILLVEGTDNSFTNLGKSVDTAVTQGAGFVSNSYGVAGEFPAETTYDHYYNHQGVAVTASTGDVGNVQNWPATNPNVVAVGGTTLTPNASTRGWAETAWSNGGSGCSLYELKPTYQTNLTTLCAKRANADIAADANPITGLAVYDTLGYGGWLQVGGTSLASPLVAAMYALAGTPSAGTYPVTYPYADPTGLYDITAGQDGTCGTLLCQAGPGWDGPTGLGTPHGVNALKFRAPSTVSASAATITYGTSGSVHVSVNSTPQATGTVRVLHGTTVLGTASLANATANVALGRTALQPGQYSLTVRFAGSATVNPSSTTVSVKVVRAATSVSAHVTNTKVVVNKTRPTIAVKVTAAGFRPGGTVVVKRGTVKVGTGTLHLGRVTITANAFKRAGQQTLTVHYLGSTQAAGSGTKITVNVVKG
ncbi:MAG: Ig-like domain repeat protein [Nocardioidaceae bacterium]